MGLRSFVHARARQIQFVLVCLIGAGAATSGVIYFNTPPIPHPQARIGSVVFDLKQLDYGLTYEDLQSLGLFADVRCRKCRFERGGRIVSLEDLDDSSFMSSLLRYEHTLSVTFYSAEPLLGRERLDALARELRARFAGHGRAMRIFRGVRDEEEITAE